MYIGASFTRWFAYRYRWDSLTPEQRDWIERYMPNRLRFYDNLDLSLWPLEGRNPYTPEDGRDNTPVKPPQPEAPDAPEDEELLG